MQDSASEFKSGKQLEAAMLAKLKASGLTSADAKKLQLKPFMQSEVLKRMPLLPAHRAGFHIPYFDLKGKPTDFYRFRYLEYGQSNGFAKLVGKDKPLRYGQAAKTLNEIYLPPFVDWSDRAKDPSKPIIITEGELKAACATRMGYPTIGLGGVWCFRAGGKLMKLLPMFEEFDWTARPVFICYDSDAATNPNIIFAENTLADALTEAGAIPAIARMPKIGEGKTGLDDYLVARGTEALQEEVLDKAIPWLAAKELFRLNSEVLYVTDPGVVLRLENMQRLSPRAFHEHAYADRIFLQQVPGPNNSLRVVEKSAPKEWLKWPHRAKAASFTYRPGEERITSEGKLNTWHGWGCSPEKGDVKPWKELLDYLFTGADSEEHKVWFERWLAYPLQHPGAKLYSAAVMWGREQGTGKSLVGYTMFEIYGRNATEISDRDLNSSYNDWTDSRQFVMGDEIAGGDKRSVADRMKSIITQRQVRVNAKYVPVYTIPDCVNYYFTSNHPDAFFLEDSDRRFFVHEVCSSPKEHKFYQRYADWLFRSAGASALFDHLLRLDLGDFKAEGRAPITTSKREMIEDGRSDVATWVANLKENADSILAIGGKPMPWKLWTTGELFAIFNPNGTTRVTANGLGRELRRAGFRRVFRAQPVPVKGGMQRLWAIRDREKMLALNSKELRDVYEKERGEAGVKAIGAAAGAKF